MFGLFYRSSCRSRLIFKVSNQQQSCLNTTSLLSKKPSSTIATTTTKQQQQRKRKPPSLTKHDLLSTPAHSFAISPPSKTVHRRTTNRSQPLTFQQCAGLRLRDGKPCQRQIPVDPKHVSPTTLAYCHDHRPLVTTTTAESSPSNSPSHLIDTTNTPTVPPYLTSFSMESERSIASSPIDDCWSLWIGKHIGPKKRKRIQQEMIKPISPKDESGYLYAYHLTKGPRVSTHHYCYFKIGRSINPTRRVAQVLQKCNYQPKLLDIIPGKRRITKQQQLSAAAMATAETDRMLKCPISHRVERLIHLELSALYPITAGFKCQGCGTTHREWFRVKRPVVQVQTGDTTSEQQWRRMTDQEVWMTKIRPVMLHWIQYGVAASALRQALGSPSSSLDPLLD